MASVEASAASLAKANDVKAAAKTARVEKCMVMRW